MKHDVITTMNWPKWPVYGWPMRLTAISELLSRSSHELQVYKGLVAALASRFLAIHNVNPLIRATTAHIIAAI